MFALGVQWAYIISIGKRNSMPHKGSKMETKITYINDGKGSGNTAIKGLVLTTDHPLSSYGQPVAILDGEPISWADMVARGISEVYTDFNPIKSEPQDLVGKANTLLSRVA